MLIYEYKLDGTKEQYAAIDEAIRITQFIGTRTIETFPVKHIKRVRLIRRADGYFVQFCVKADLPFLWTRP